MKYRKRLAGIAVTGVILIAVGVIVALGLYRDDGKPVIQPLSPEKAEAVRRVARERGIIARHQALARGQYNATEYASVQFAAEWDAAAALPRQNREAEYKRLRQRAQQEIQARHGEFERALANSRSGNNTAAWNALQRIAGDNLDFGLRIAALALARQEAALRTRKIKFNTTGKQLEETRRDAEEKAIQKQEDACLAKKAELNLVRNNRSSVIALIVKQARQQAK